jgi:hypothetical protein
MEASAGNAANVAMNNGRRNLSAVGWPSFGMASPISLRAIVAALATASPCSRFEPSAESREESLLPPVNGSRRGEQ